MNKAQLVDELAKKHSVPKAKAEAILNSTIQIIKSSVQEGDVVTFVGFGSFYKANRKARKARNPHTGKEIEIPAHAAPKFRAGLEFKKMLKD